jgi:hypothetical protein
MLPWTFGRCSWYWVLGLGCLVVSGFGFRVLGFVFGVWGSGIEVQGLGVGVEVGVKRVWGLGFRSLV